MTKNFHSSFRQDLAQIISRYNNIAGGSLSNFGTKLAGAIAEEIEYVCNDIDTIKTKSNLLGLISNKFPGAKIKPKVYLDNGHTNCDDLFFEHKFNPKGAFAAIGFYLPCIFTTDKQKRELKSFTKDWNQKVLDINSIEFYFAICHIPDDSIL